MKYKHVALGFVTSFAALAIGVSIANYSGQIFPQRAEPVIYGLTLDSSNRITASYSSTERSLSTASGNWTVSFDYTNVSPLTGGHCTIENGGQLVNSDHILSIEELTINFSTTGTLRFRTSYDASTWGAYNDAVSGENYTLSSHPYYVEFSALNANVDLYSVSYGYTCAVNEEAGGSTGDTLLGVIDFWNTANVTDTGTVTEINTTYVNNLSYSDLAHTNEIDVASNITSSRSYQNRYGGIGLGSNKNVGSFTLTLLSAYHVDRISVSGLAYDTGTSNLSVTGSSASITTQSFSTKRNGNVNDIDIAQTLEWTFQESQSTLTFACGSGRRLALYRVMLYSQGMAVSAPIDEVGFTATDSNASNYSESSIFDTDNALTVVANFSNGTTTSLTKGSLSNNYSYVIKNSINQVISSSSSFGSAGNYTLIVSYKSYIPVHINLTVSEDAVAISSIEAILVEDQFTTSDTLTLTDNLLVDIFYSDSSSASNLEYADLAAYGLSFSLITPGGVDYNIANVFGTAGNWTLKVYDSTNPSVYCNIAITVVAVNVSGVSIDQGTLSLEVGQNATLVANVTPTDATNKNVNWTSTAPSVASVTNSGLVTALAAGSTTITASTADGGYQASCNVTVTAPAAPSGYSLVTSSDQLSAGDDIIFAYKTSSFTAGPLSSTFLTQLSDATFSSDKNTITDPGSSLIFTLGGTSGAWTFANSSDQTLKSSAAKNVNFTNGTATWTISVDGSGNATVTSTSTSNGSLQYNVPSPRFTTYTSAQGAIQIYKTAEDPIYATSIDVTPSSASIGIGEATNLSVSFTPSNTNQKDITWSSSDSNKASVSTNGFVTGVAVGTATITATVATESGTTTDTCYVTVSEIAATGVSLSNSSISLNVDGTSTLTASVLPANATNKNVTWSSNNTSVATVNSSGLVTAISIGSATIMVTTADGGYTDTCSVTVQAAPAVQKTQMAYDYSDYTNNNQYNLDSTPLSGSPKLLIIPIWFTDSSTYITNDTYKANVLSDIEKVYLGTAAETGWNSVSSFYNTESAGKVNLTGTVTDWYSAGQTTAYYGDAYDGGDRTTSLVTTASSWYFTNNPSDSRSNYDTDNDGYLDGVMLIYGAPDYSAGSSSYDNLWAYCYWLQGSNNISNPVPNVFFWASYDFMYGSNTATSRAGSSYNGGDTSHCSLDAHTFIHEMGHVFGLDDYYDYSGQYQPAGGFSMQDYNVGGHDPYSVMAYGWADPYIPTETCEITIGAFQSTHDVILLTPSWNSYDSPFDEYLLLELYTPTGLNQMDATYQYNGNYPQGPSTTGIRLWHVDARLTRYSGGSYSTSLNANAGASSIYHAMSNTYYKSGDSSTSYISPLGSSYANYNILQLIKNSTTADYTENTDLISGNLFVNNSTFSMAAFNKQFVNSGKLNSNIDLGWTFTVSITGSGASATATISLVKA